MVSVDRLVVADYRMSPYAVDSRIVLAGPFLTLEAAEAYLRRIAVRLPRACVEILQEGDLGLEGAHCGYGR